MLWHITKRELYDHFTSLRFALTVGLTILLMVLNALFFVGSDYRQRMEEYSKNISSVADSLKAESKHLNELAEDGPIALYKHPSPLAFCANDQEDALSMRIHAGFHSNWGAGDSKHFYGWNSPWQLQYVQDSYQKNSMQPLSTALDWAFIIGLVLSFVAILFTFDAISGEREHGTLALMLSNPVSRAMILLGKFFGAFIAIAIPMLMGMLLSLLIVMISGLVSLSGDDWARLGLMGTISLIYVALFIGVGLAISSRMEHSSTSLLVLLLIWVILVALVPNTLGSVVSTWRQVSSQREMQQQKDAAIKALERTGSPWDTNSPRSLFKYGSPTDPNPKREAIELWGNYLTKRLEIETRFEDEHLDAQFAQVEFARQILHISPTVIYNYAMEALAGTGFQRYRQFVEASRRYREQFIEFIKTTDRSDPESPHVYYIKEGLSKKPMSFDSIPKFKEPMGVGVAFRSTLMDMSLLILIAGLGFMASYLAFLKCVVKCEAEDMAYHYPVPVDSEQPVDQEEIVPSRQIYPIRT